MILSFIYENTVLIGIIIIIGLIYLNKKYGFEFMTTNPDKENKTDDSQSIPDNEEAQPSTSRSESESNAFCDDVNCVRCRKYKTVIDEAFMKLMFIEDNAIAGKVECGLKLMPNLLPRGQTNDSLQQPNVFLYQGLTARPVWNSNTFADCTLIEKEFQYLKAEFLALTKEPAKGIWKRNRTPTGSWDVFHLLNQGEMVPKNADLCPATVEVIRSLQSVMFSNVFGNVMFSVVKPGTFITEHYGPTNVRLRCHLGINIIDECVLTVDEERLQWTEGKCLVFDDSFLHSVTHFGERPDTPPSAKKKLSFDVDDNAEEATMNQLKRSSKGSEEEPLITNVAKSTNADQSNESSSLKNKNENAVMSSIDEFNPETDRVVFIVDLWHPDLNLEERGAIDLVFAP